MQITKCLSMFTNQTYYFSTCILGFVELFYYEIIKKNNFKTFIVFLSHRDINNNIYQPYAPPHEKTNNLHRQKERHRSASKSKISSL